MVSKYFRFFEPLYTLDHPSTWKTMFCELLAYLAQLTAAATPLGLPWRVIGCVPTEHRSHVWTLAPHKPPLIRPYLPPRTGASSFM